VEEKGKQAEERQDEPRLWRPWRPPSRRMGWRVLWRVLWAVGMVVAVLTLTGLLIVERPEIWDGRLGLLENKNSRKFTCTILYSPHSSGWNSDSSFDPTHSSQHYM
jgi:hypothetical protein